MKYHIRWLTCAMQNLSKEADYIKKYHPNAAKAFVQQVQQQTNFLAEHPHLGRAGRIPGMRELALLNYPYIIPYRVRENYIDFLRVFHTARKYPLH